MTAFNLRAARLNQGLSPEALGERIGIAGGTIRRLERGEKPTPTVAAKVAAFLGQQVEDLWPELLEDPQETR